MARPIHRHSEERLRREAVAVRIASSLIAVLLAGCASGAPLPGRMTPVLAARAAAPVPTIGGCQIFPAPGPGGPSGNDWWNTDISHYPVDPKSATYLRSMHASTEFLHPDFGQNPTYGIPFEVVPADQKRVPVSFLYASSSNPGPYPIPPNAPIEGGTHSTGDRHVLILQQGVCKLYELWRAFPKDGGKRWQAGSGAVFDLGSNALRPNGWTSADAAGLPILPALVKCSEVKAGAIDHALRVTFDRTQNGYIHPATHEAGQNDPSYPPMGLRLRLKASYDLTKFNRTARIILTAMQHYGMFVADNGSDWYFQGEGTGLRRHSCWNDNDLNALKSVPGSAFEVVHTGPILH
jgi:hypothetical protein